MLCFFQKQKDNKTTNMIVSVNLLLNSFERADSRKIGSGGLQWYGGYRIVSNNYRDSQCARSKTTYIFQIMVVSTWTHHCSHY